MDPQSAHHGSNSVAITIEKDQQANAHSRKQRQSIQRSLGFKNVIIYILVFVNLLLCSKLFALWSRSRDDNDNNGSFASSALGEHEGEGEGGDTFSPEFWIKMGVIVALVLIGGIFAGKSRLTIGLMGLDETNLQVLMASGSNTEKAHAETVYNLLSRGKHWVLVTLLLGNVIVNETLPVVLDSELGGGIVAILISTLLIVVFGEIIPQAVCARYGLAIGAYCAKPMLVLMYVMSPVAYPIAWLLDSWLGVHHGTTYRRTELKTLVSLHQVDGIGELSDDEVTIIASVLDLKEKPISSVMTPLEDVFTLSEDAILDEQLMEEIVSAGYSRIPIYRHDDANNFIGMLLVKRLITYDPEDHIPVRRFTINSLPEAAPNTSCLDILNFFQEGRSHMAIVTSEPGGFGVPVGVITLEDVIEELLGEEIVDESDVYVDVHNKIKVIRKPPRNINMIKSLKTLLQSPAAAATATESTPLLGSGSSANGRTVTMPIDNKYIATGKTILQSQKSASGLLETGAIVTPVKKAEPEPAHPFQAGSLQKGDDHHHHKDGHVNFKDSVEVIKATETTSPSNEQQERTIVIEVPEATDNHAVNPPSEVAAAVVETVKVVEREATVEPPVTTSVIIETPAESRAETAVIEAIKVVEHKVVEHKVVEQTVTTESPVTTSLVVETSAQAPVIETVKVVEEKATVGSPIAETPAESSTPSRQMTESESTSTLLSTGGGANTGPSSSKKKKKKKKSTK
ncbi:hypothetical protein BGZ79_003461 [Entomortierella chlamydospora]|nr:hypothetical protein BGZ79_003461 [Entomortierella chlamydospora]